LREVRLIITIWARFARRSNDKSRCNATSIATSRTNIANQLSESVGIFRREPGIKIPLGQIGWQSESILEGQKADQEGRTDSNHDEEGRTGGLRRS
jgi:hypothetical protein